MIVVGNIITRDRYSDRWLVAFDDPERGLTPSDPVYLHRNEFTYELVNLIEPVTGEIHHTVRLGPAKLAVSEHVWEMMPNFRVSVVDARERELRAQAQERKDAEKRRTNARNLRRQHDAQIRKGKPHAKT